MKTVFDFNDYKTFLSSIEDSRKQFERGFRAKLAKELGCQGGYISQVLNGNSHLSLEQTLKAANFLNLKEREKKYFLLLVEHSRAGTKELSQYFDNELKILKEEHLNIKERVGQSVRLSENEQSIYYSSWYYLVIHTLVSIPGYDEVDIIAKTLKISDDVVKKVLLFLVQSGILIEKNGKISSGLTQVHLNRESPLIRQHHTNLRVAAIHSFMSDSQTDLHYSTFSSMSLADVEKLRVDMVKLIEHYVKTVKPSKEETVVGFNLDFFKMIK